MERGIPPALDMGGVEHVDSAEFRGNKCGEPCPLALGALQDCESYMEVLLVPLLEPEQDPPNRVEWQSK